MNLRRLTAADVDVLALGVAVELIGFFFDLAQRIKRISGARGEIVFQPLHYADVELRIPNVKKAREVLALESPEIAQTLLIHLPDEATRRVGQSIAAASLPRLKAH